MKFTAFFLIFLSIFSLLSLSACKNKRVNDFTFTFIKHEDSDICLLRLNNSKYSLIGYGSDDKSFIKKFNLLLNNINADKIEYFVLTNLSESSLNFIEYVTPRYSITTYYIPFIYNKTQCEVARKFLIYLKDNNCSVSNYDNFITLKDGDCTIEIIPVIEDILSTDNNVTFDNEIISSPPPIIYINKNDKNAILTYCNQKFQTFCAPLLFNILDCDIDLLKLPSSNANEISQYFVQCLAPENVVFPYCSTSLSQAQIQNFYNANHLVNIFSSNNDEYILVDLNKNEILINTITL